MAAFADRLKTLRRERDWSQQRLADELKISKISVNMYERGEREPSFETMEAIADIFNVDMDYLYGRSDIKISDPIQMPTSPIVPVGFEPLPQMTQVPLVGRIACGQPITAEQNIESVIGVPSAWHADFALTCRGDSMQPRYLDGDIVCIHRQPEVENGQIAAVRIGEEATLKRFYRQGDTVTLQAENPAYPPLVYQKEELNSIAIEGRVVGFCRGEK